MPIFVSPQWLSQNLQNPAVKILDASWHMPNTGRNARVEFDLAHIPGAQFFDLDAVSDHTTPLPHMLPKAEDFAQAMGTLGIRTNDHVVIYDSLGLFSAPRARWTFQCFGHAQVSILEGGLPAWQAAGLPMSDVHFTPAPQMYHINAPLAHVMDKAGVQQAIDAHVTIVDARSAARFNGQVDEPRPGLKRGHITTSCNVPFGDVVENGRLKSPEQLRAIFSAAGVDIAKPVITTCGSGVTAAILDLALESLGCTDRQLYDGSWAEWGAVEQ